MTVTWKEASDLQRLKELVAAAGNAKQRDRYRVVLLAGEGSALVSDGSASHEASASHRQLTREQIAEIVGRSRQFVDQWAGRYRSKGLPGLIPRRPKGRPSKLTSTEQQELCGMLDRGPSSEEGIAAYNGPILRELIEKRFKKIYKLDAVYKLLHRLGYNDLMPRPHHPGTDPAALEAFKKKELPEKLAEIKAAHPGKRVLSYYQDEARFGQHGTLTRIWARVGSRPGAIRQTQYDYLYLFTAVCPETGDAAGLITASINTDAMNAFLDLFSRELPADVHAVMVLDRAGWHTSAKLKIPCNVSLVHLPPKSPQLNPAENLWHYLRSHYWSNRLYATWEDLKTAASDAWRRVRLVPEMIQTICADTALCAS